MRKRKRNRKRKKFLPLLLPALLTLLCFFLLEKSLLPPLKEISHMQCKAAANRIIDEAAANALARMELDASALLQKGADGESYTANTTCVNQFCALLSRDITKQLNELPKEVIPIPLGAATHWGLLANKGRKSPSPFCLWVRSGWIMKRRFPPSASIRLTTKSGLRYI